MQALSIGSCRVVAPLNHLEEQGELEVVRSGLWAHTHEPAEQLQQLRYLRGEFKPPEELAPLIAGPDFNGQRGTLDEVDVLIVEVCSRKSFTYRDYVLHHFFAADQLEEAGLEDWARLLRNGKLPDDRSEFLRDDLTEIQRSLVLDARRDILTEEEIRQGMHALRELFTGPILFATHWEAIHPNGAHVVERQQLIDWVTEISADMGLPCFSPSAIIRKAGRDNALQDAHHYRDEFVPSVAEAINDHLMTAVA